MKTISNKAVNIKAVKSFVISIAVMGSVLLTALSISVSVSVSAASLQEKTGFGNNPSNLRMHLYVPDALPNNAPILVASHYCGGTGPNFYSGTQFASLADRYGFIVIYPSATRSGQCFDVSSSQALTHNGGSDPVSIMSMVSYVKQNFNVDSTRIFATGVSSGAMMTNVLLGAYPDVFKAGAAFAGVPFGCFATTDGSMWNSNCATGKISKTAQEWGNLVRAAYPGYGGNRPRMQLWHGTSDETLNYANFNEAIKQWTNVHSLTQTPTFTDTPQSGYTRTRYGSSGGQAQVEAISMQGVVHNLPVNAAEAIRFFGLDSAVVPSSSSSPQTASSRSPQTASSITPTQGTNTIEVRMLGASGAESVSLQVGGTTVTTWMPTTAMASYTTTTNLGGEIRVAFTNDATGRDVRVDYIVVNGTTRQAEDQQTNTGSYNNTCGGGSFSEWMYCGGYIVFGTVGTPMATSSSSSSIAITPSSIAASMARSSTPPPSSIPRSIPSSVPRSIPSSVPTSVAQSSSSSNCVSTGQMCNWYGTPGYPLCVTTQTGWGWEDQKSCISRTTCSGQPAPYGITGGVSCPASASASSIMVTPSSRSMSSNRSSSIALASSTPSSVVSIASSSSASAPSDPLLPTGKENSGAGCFVPEMPAYASLATTAALPNPFKSINGSTIASKYDWTCRRAEINKQAQVYELGEKPEPATAQVTATASATNIAVTVQDAGKSISFNASIQVPSTGTAPYPAVIGMGGSSLNNAALLSRGIAVITFPNNEIAEQTDGSSRGKGKFYTLYGNGHGAGAMSAWAWGVSRLIDALEKTPTARIDASHLGMTGCSRNGKGALIAGALDERIMLTIPQESGSGGSAAWRVSDAQKTAGQNVQTLSQITSENVWFRSSFSQFNNTATKLPFDHHEILGMVAPRALLVIENTSMEWLGNVSAYSASIAAREIWLALGIGDRMGVSQVGNHDHCAFPASQQPEVNAFVDKFLKGVSNTNTNVVKTDGTFTVDRARWINWPTPNLQ